MAHQDRVTIKIHNAIAFVQLNRSDKLNALDMAMFKAIDNTMKTLKKDRDIRAIVVSGNGEDFCSGLDVKSVMTSPINSIKLLFKLFPGSANLAQRVSTAWRDIPVPVIVAVHGRCWGGGLQIALGGDIRFATPDSDWSIMEGKWGLIPDMGGTIALRELVKQDVAMELAMTAKQLTGEQAKTLGLVTHVDAEPLAAATKLAEELVQRSPDAIAGVKKLYQTSWWSSQGWALFRESWYQIKILAGKNQRRATTRAISPDKISKTPYLPRKRW